MLTGARSAAEAARPVPSPDHLGGRAGRDLRRTAEGAALSGLPAAGSWRSTWPVFVVSVLARGVLLAACGLLLCSMLPLLVGWQSNLVMTGSMSPAIHPGDVVMSRPVSQAELHLGHVLVVDDPDRPGRLRVHRLVGVEDGLLRLKGDATQDRDSSLVAPEAVHGAGTLLVPFIGRPVVWFSEGVTGPLLPAVAAAVALTGAAFLYRDPSPRPSAGGGRPRDGRPRRRNARA